MSKLSPHNTIACEIINNFGADIEDRLELYRGLSETASGQLQSLTFTMGVIKDMLRQAREGQTIGGVCPDKKTLKVLEKKIRSKIVETEKDITRNVSKREAYQEVVSYVKHQHDKFSGNGSE